MVTAVQNHNPKRAKTAIWCITPNGFRHGQKLMAHLAGCTLFMSEKTGKGLYSQKDMIVFKRLSDDLPKAFNRFEQHICFFSTGIAVRLICGLLQSKTTDPAVVTVDDAARFAVSLVSGHLGGANRLAEDVAGILSAQPVITTATDSNKLPAIDVLAKEHNLFIETPGNIKHVNMAFLLNEPVRLNDPDNRIAPFLGNRFVRPVPAAEKESCDIVCSYKIAKVSRETLVLRPPVLSLGIGCNRGTSFDMIHGFLVQTLKKEGISIHSICRVGTIDVKKDEKGLRRLAETLGLPLDLYSNKMLNTVKTIKTPSKMAQKHVGAQSVCEAAAILSANNGKLIVTKTKNRDVTLAVAMIK